MEPPHKGRGCSGGDRATPKVLPNWNYRIAQRTRMAIVRVAVWGLIPVSLVHWVGGGHA